MTTLPACAIKADSQLPQHFCHMSVGFAGLEPAISDRCSATVSLCPNNALGHTLSFPRLRNAPNFSDVTRHRKPLNKTQPRPSP